jgi:hypothetical protein
LSYSIGDKIVYPMHGAGVIVDKVNRKIMDEIRCYYVVKSPISEMVAMLPVDNMDGIGIRDVITDSEADELLDEIKTMDTEETSNWNKRYRENMEKLKDGSMNCFITSYRTSISPFIILTGFSYSTLWKLTTRSVYSSEKYFSRLVFGEYFSRTLFSTASYAKKTAAANAAKIIIKMTYFHSFFNNYSLNLCLAYF